ncbi:MAG: hypothetical protein R2708_11425 [Vicinamibacterales bacterium]
MRIASRCWAASSKALGGRGLDHAPLEVGGQFLDAAFEQQPHVVHRPGVAVGRADGGHARRQAALDVMLQARRARSPVIVSLQDRSPNSLWLSVIVRRASDAGRNGPAQVAVTGHLPGDQHAGEGLAQRQAQVGIVLVVAQQDVEPGRAA